jgi:asparagine synthase (glutamine-hydrolysing)
MCGIAGFLYYNSVYNEDQLHTMTDKLVHRGPDAEGYFFDGICGLGHRRLSIIDLSVNANQPMYSSNKRYVMVYNGEVYNFEEISNRILQLPGNKDFKFATTSDTEVILEAFLHFGVDFVNHLNGMFAIAIYDTIEKELYLFRDRLGIKPLFYFWNGKNIVFASELKSIESLSEITLNINKNAIAEFLHLGFIPAPNTIYENVFKLNPGCYLQISKNGLERIKYWNLSDKLHSTVVTNKAEAISKLSDLLISSVRYQLRSDVPFGVFLSGGIDSSLITAIATTLSDNKINTFSIGFLESKVNEAVYAKAVAAHLGTQHHEFIISHKEVINSIELGFEAYDEPNADSSIIPTLLVSKLAKEHVTVALSGEGGDELFLGYGSYQWAQRLSSPIYKLLKKPASEILRHMSSRYQRIGKMIDTSASLNRSGHIFSQEQYFFSNKEISNLALKPFSFPGYLNDFIENENNFSKPISEILNSKSKTSRHLNPMEQQALFDIIYYLPDDLLTKVDRASMQYSLETRVPYLDHRVLEYALNISPDLKFRDNSPKYILKEILYQYVPKQLFDRPKQGFSIPLNKLLKHELKYLIDDYLHPDLIKKTGFVKAEEVKIIIDNFLSGNNYLFNRLWLLIVLHKWAKDHHVQA